MDIDLKMNEVEDEKQQGFSRDVRRSFQTDILTSVFSLIFFDIFTRRSIIGARLFTCFVLLLSHASRTSSSLFMGVFR